MVSPRTLLLTPSVVRHHNTNVDTSTRTTQQDQTTRYNRRYNVPPPTFISCPVDPPLLCDNPPPPSAAHAALPRGQDKTVRTARSHVQEEQVDTQSTQSAHGAHFPKLSPTPRRLVSATSRPARRCRSEVRGGDTSAQRACSSGLEGVLRGMAQERDIRGVSGRGGRAWAAQG